MKKILIVDQSDTMRKIILRVLGQAGLQVESFREASNGREGLQCLVDDPDVELVLSDIHMREMDGISFVKAVRADHDKETLPMVLIGTDPESETVQRAMDSGANGYVSKPLTTQGMRDVLAGYFGTNGGEGI